MKIVDVFCNHSDGKGRIEISRINKKTGAYQKKKYNFKKGDRRATSKNIICILDKCETDYQKTLWKEYFVRYYHRG